MAYTLYHIVPQVFYPKKNKISVFSSVKFWSRSYVDITHVIWRLTLCTTSYPRYSAQGKTKFLFFVPQQNFNHRIFFFSRRIYFYYLQYFHTFDRFFLVTFLISSAEIFLMNSTWLLLSLQVTLYIRLALEISYSIVLNYTCGKSSRNNFATATSRILIDFFRSSSLHNFIPKICQR